MGPQIDTTFCHDLCSDTPLRIAFNTYCENYGRSGCLNTCYYANKMSGKLEERLASKLNDRKRLR